MHVHYNIRVNCLVILLPTDCHVYVYISALHVRVYNVKLMNMYMYMYMYISTFFACHNPPPPHTHMYPHTQTPPSLSAPTTSRDYLGTAVYSTELTCQYHIQYYTSSKTTMNVHVLLLGVQGRIGGQTRQTGNLQRECGDRS